MDYVKLLSHHKLHVKQVLELAEIVIPWETRNKYRILDEQGQQVGFAAEQSTGLAGNLLRGVLGHWRKFDIFIFNQDRQKVLELHFPFRWFFKSLLVKAGGAPLGQLEQRFSLLYKKFDVLDVHGVLVATIRSPFWRLWTFEFIGGGRRIATIKKRWSGALGELFTDKDNFEVLFEDPAMGPELRAVVLSTCLMVDIIYFENNHKRGGNFLDVMGS